MRKKLYELVNADDTKRCWYDYFMMVVIIFSIIPLAFKTQPSFFDKANYFIAAIFSFDYLVRWLTADFKTGKGLKSFLLYPVTPMAIIDLLALLPSFGLMGSGFRVLKIFRLFRTFRVFRALRVFRAFKMFRYSKSINIIINVVKRQATPLIAVGTLAFGYIIISALVVFNVEPDTFSNFFEAIYWATVSLTTVGYGDIYPVSAAGRVITMLSSFVGIAIVALPSGIITAGYMDEINK